MVVVLRPFENLDTSAVLDLNQESVAVLSPMDAVRFEWLRGMAAVLEIAVEQKNVIGFLMAFTDGQNYDSQNYKWFLNRFKNFLYIDRVVIDQTKRGLGVGKSFYESLEQHARTFGLHWLVCEVDTEPANPASLAFHAKLGFFEVGVQTLNNKSVVMLARQVFYN